MAPGDHGPRAAHARGLRVIVVDGDGRRIAAAALSRWLARVAPPSARGTVTIALAADARVRALNRTYRRRDCATDVLSFPSEQSKSPPRRAQRTQTARPGVGGSFLGDIVIATGVARRQAREAGHPEQTELRVLALHGLLHLLGYNHETDDGRMARVERRLRRQGRLHEGLIERSRA